MMSIPEKVKLMPIEDEKKESRMVRGVKNATKFLLRTGFHLSAILAISAAATPHVDRKFTDVVIDWKTPYLNEEKRELLRPITEIDGDFSSLEDILIVAQANTTGHLEYSLISPFESHVRAVLNGRGVCEEYANLTYIGAHDYMMENEEELGHYLDDIRLVFSVSKDAQGGHTWLQFYTAGEWKDFETTIDLNKPGDEPKIYPVETFLGDVEEKPLYYLWLDKAGQKHYKFEGSDYLSFGETALQGYEKVSNKLFPEYSINPRSLLDSRIQPTFYIVAPIIAVIYRGILDEISAMRKHSAKPLNKKGER